MFIWLYVNTSCARLRRLLAQISRDELRSTPARQGPRNDNEVK